MTLLSLGIACCLVVLLLIKTIATLMARRRYRAEAARQGCEPAPLVPEKGLLGLIRVRDNLKAIREERGPQLYVEALKEISTSEEIHTAQLEGDSQLVKTHQCPDVKQYWAPNL